MVTYQNITSIAKNTLLEKGIFLAIVVDVRYFNQFAKGEIDIKKVPWVTSC